MPPPMHLPVIVPGFGPVAPDIESMTAFAPCSPTSSSSQSASPNCQQAPADQRATAIGENLSSWSHKRAEQQANLSAGVPYRNFRMRPESSQENGSLSIDRTVGVSWIALEGTQNCCYLSYLSANRTLAAIYGS